MRFPELFRDGTSQVHVVDGAALGERALGEPEGAAEPLQRRYQLPAAGDVRERRQDGTCADGSAWCFVGGCR